MRETTEIEISFEEDGSHTVAHASMALRGITFGGWGRASRNPTDASVPMIGEELAAARALSDLAHTLVEAAAETISAWERTPAHVTG